MGLDGINFTKYRLQRKRNPFIGSGGSSACFKPHHQPCTHRHSNATGDDIVVQCLLTKAKHFDLRVQPTFLSIEQKKTPLTRQSVSKSQYCTIIMPFEAGSPAISFSHTCENCCSTFNQQQSRTIGFNTSLSIKAVQFRLHVNDNNEFQRLHD